MFAGKTSAMIHKVQCRIVAGRSVIVLKAQQDVRDKETEDTLRSHGGQPLDCRRVGTTLMDIVSDVCTYDVVAVDDGHFFTDVSEFCRVLADTHHTEVLVAALDADFTRAPFLNVCRLVAMAEYVTKLHAVCKKCHQKASYSARCDASENAPRFEVGAGDLYVPLCRTCYLAHVKKMRAESQERMDGIPLESHVPEEARWRVSLGQEFHRYEVDVPGWDVNAALEGGQTKCK